MQDRSPPMYKPALISGVTTGVAGSLSVFFLGACAQCTCCLLIAGCGFFAAYLHSKDCRNASAPFTEGNGATVGLMGGLVYGVFSGAFGSLAISIAGNGDWREAIDLMRDAGFAPAAKSAVGFVLRPVNLMVDHLLTVSDGLR